MSSSVEHTDVGAYALGLLEEPDRLAFEAHLATCERCRAELDDFGDMDAFRGLFDDVDPDAFTPMTRPFPPLEEARFPGLHGAGEDPSEAAPPAQTVVTAGVVAPAASVGDADGAQVVDLAARREARARRSRLTGLWVAAAAAAAALLVAGAALGGGFSDEKSPSVAQSPDHHVMPTTPSGALLVTGTRYPAEGEVAGVDGVTGFAATESKGWGSHVAVQLGGVRGPLKCSMIAVGKAGNRETLGSWTVPAKGYGVPGNPDPLTFHGGSSMTVEELDRIEVVTFEGKTLLTVPV